MIANKNDECFKYLKGKIIAIVYIFEGDNSSGMEHFFIWKSNIIAKWMEAIQRLHCIPLILDVRTFVDKAMNKTLPKIDYVINMNSGTYNLSSMALVPATCSSINVPCIPCDAVTIISGESKSLSNLIANSIGLNIPPKMVRGHPDGIFRPDNLGNSLGVIKSETSIASKGLYQEFICGYDITTPFVYNPLSESMEILPTVIHLPKKPDKNWFYSEEVLANENDFEMKVIKIDKKTEEKYLELVEVLSIKTYCRLDARLKTATDDFYHIEANDTSSFEDVYFLEMNVMPTIRPNNSFSFSFFSINDKHPMYKCLMAQKKEFGEIDLNCFLLANSMLSIKTRY
jgi:hypothetical protein